MFFIKSIVLASVAVIGPNVIWNDLLANTAIANVFVDRDTTTNTKVDQACRDAEFKTASAHAEDGQCQATWSCDQKTFKVLCKDGNCECFIENEKEPYNKIKLDSCSTDKLESCFTLEKKP